jgi:PAS domain S-box-containing protein
MLSADPLLGNGWARGLEQFFPGDSEMARCMRAFDWSQTELGPPHAWPENLQIAVRLCLTSAFPISLWWGPRYLLLYNDAYLPRLGEANRYRALMQPAREVWAEICDVIGPMLDSVFATGTAIGTESQELFYDRAVPREEVYISWSFGPVMSADGRSVDGVFCPCAEHTEKVVGARRLETLRKLGVRSTSERTIDAACQEAVAIARENPRDIPFAAIYVMDPEGEYARCSATVLSGGTPRLPDVVRLRDIEPGSPWPFARVLRTQCPTDCVDLEAKGIQISGPEWPEPVRQAIVLPLQAAQDQLAGWLIVGASPRRPLDDEYRTFFELVAGHVATAIAHAKAHEAELQRLEALAQIDREKTAFFSNISHEFRTPLTLMLGPIEDMLARSNGSLSVERHELELVHRNGLRMLKLVNTLLDFSRIEEGGARAHYEPVDLPAFTTGLASVFRAAIEKAGLRLVIDCPALDQPVYVDRSMWEKIVLNLLSNAFKFTFEGQISVSLQRDSSSVVLEVEDTGNGIAEHELPRVFERFHRVEGAIGRTQEGSGIGLALVQELARLHGGLASVESRSGHGSTFRVSIPLGQAHLREAEVGEPQSSTGIRAQAFAEEAMRWLPVADDTTLPHTSDRVPASASAGRILLADDNADLRQYVHRSLLRTYDVDLAADGEAALAMALAHPPDLVLTDVMMPRLDGVGLLRALRSDARTSHIPVILLSARAGEEARMQGLEAGANDYLVKPFSARELLARVDTNLKAARASSRAIEREQRLRKSAEDAKVLTQAKLALELSAMTRLHDSNSHVLTERDLDAVLERVMSAIMTLQNADRGMVQLYDDDTRLLRVVAACGFSPESIARFGDADENSDTPSRRALESGLRVSVEDVLQESAFLGTESDGFRAMQCTPLFGRGGEMLGVISTQFLRPHQPTEHELRLTDLYARQAAEVIERHTAQAELFALKDELADDLKAMTRLHDLATRLLSNAGLQQLLEDVLDTSITLAGADFGHIQLYDEAAGTLKVAAQRGFEPEYLRYIENVQDKLGIASSIGRVDRVIFEDILDEPAFQAHLPAVSPLGYRALQATPLRGSCGQLLGVITTHFRKPHRCSDRTLRFLSLCARHAEELIERQRAERALRASDERFRRYFDLGLVGMVIYSTTQGCLEVNDELCRILGYERKDLLGKTCEDFTHPDDRAADDVQLARVVAGEIDGYSLEERALRRDGSVIDTIVAVQCVRRSDRSVDYFVGLVQDVTARKTAEAALLEARAELARITRVTTMGELAASIAHEVNQPLTAIITNANACARWLGAAPPNLGEANAAMDRLVRDAKRAAAVLAGIRAFLMRQPPLHTKFDLNELIVEVMAMMQGKMRANGVSSSLVPVRGSAIVTGDRVQLQQVMLNLVMNSIEAMALTTSGERRLQIDVGFAGLDELRVSVRDSGIGLTFEHRSRIFDAFHTTKPHGMGMGLAISRSIIENHGGRLWLAPKQGPGETFQFALPASARGRSSPA